VSDTQHQCFTVSSTAYIRNLDRDDRRVEHFAVHYQRAPEKTERGVSIGMIAPVLIVSLWMSEQKAIAEKVARILNKHWDDEE
jgi:hypothetical protein